MYKYENDLLAHHEIDPTTPPKYVYWNAKKLLEVLDKVAAAKMGEQNR